MSIATGLVVTCLMWGQTAPIQTPPLCQAFEISDSCVPSGINAPFPEDLTAEHLWALEKVIMDLEGAGLTELAQRIQGELKAHLEQSLGAKRDQVLRLQAEIEALQNLLHPKVQVQLELQLWELDHPTLIRLQTDQSKKLLGIIALSTKPSGNGLLEKLDLTSAELHELVVHAEEHEAAKKLSTPKIMTFSGQEAQIQIGPSHPGTWPHPVPLQFSQLGTSITVTPTIQNDNKLACHWHVRSSTLNTDLGVVPASATIPGIDYRGLSSTTKNHHGEFFVVGQPLPTGENKSLVVFATVELPSLHPEPPREQPTPQD